MMQCLYLVGTVSSGSTLLSRILDQWPGVLSVGEVRRFNLLRSRNFVCPCGQSLEDCAIWGEICRKVDRCCIPPGPQDQRGVWARRWSYSKRLLAVQLGLAGRARLLLRDELASAERSFCIAGCAASRAGAELVVDSSKLPFEFLSLFLSRPDMVRPVFLLRDGRGTVWSMMKRGGLSAEDAANRWLAGMRAILMVKRLSGFRSAPFLRYEDLCRDPEGVAGRLLSECRVGAVAGALPARPRPPHDLGGSLGLRGKAAGTFETKQDMDWVERMPPDALATFERIASGMNSRLGYS